MLTLPPLPTGYPGPCDKELILAIGTKDDADKIWAVDEGQARRSRES